MLTDLQLRMDYPVGLLDVSFYNNFLPYCGIIMSAKLWYYNAKMILQQYALTSEDDSLYSIK